MGKWPIWQTSDSSLSKELQLFTNYRSQVTTVQRGRINSPDRFLLLPSGPVKQLFGSLHDYNSSQWRCSCSCCVLQCRDLIPVCQNDMKTTWKSKISQSDFFCFTKNCFGKLRPPRSRPISGWSRLAWGRLRRGQRHGRTRPRTTWGRICSRCPWAGRYETASRSWSGDGIWNDENNATLVNENMSFCSIKNSL